MSVFEEPGLGFLITDVSRSLRRAFQRAMVGSELTWAQSRALVYVARNPGIRQVELAERLEVKPISLARLIDQLQTLELVERRPDDRDRRAYRLYHLAKSHPYLEKIEQVILSIRERAFSGLSDQQKAEMFSALILMRDNLAEDAP